LSSRHFDYPGEETSPGPDDRPLLETAPGDPDVLLGGTDPPDAMRCVVRHEQAAVGRHGHPDGTSPAFDADAARTVVHDEAGQKVFDRSRPAVRHREEHDLVAARRRSIPRAVQCHKSAATVTLRKLGVAVEGDAKRGRM